MLSAYNTRDTLKTPADYTCTMRSSSWLFRNTREDYAQYTGTTETYNVSHLLLNGVVIDDDVQGGTREYEPSSLCSRYLIGGHQWPGTSCGNQLASYGHSAEHKMQAIHFGLGMTDNEMISYQEDIVALIKVFDETDDNCSIVIDEDDVDVNSCMCAVSKAKGIGRGVTTGHLKNSDTHLRLKQFIQTAKAEGWWNKLKALYLPIWQDANINKINFKCPGKYDILDWNYFDPSYIWEPTSNWVSDGYPVNTRDKTIDNNDLLPSPYARFSADETNFTEGDSVETWADASGNSNDLSSDSSLQLALSYPEHPVYTEKGGIGENKKAIVYVYHGGPPKYRLTLANGAAIDKDSNKQIY